MKNKKPNEEKNGNHERNRVNKKSIYKKAI